MDTLPCKYANKQSGLKRNQANLLSTPTNLGKKSKKKKSASITQSTSNENSSEKKDLTAVKNTSL